MKQELLAVEVRNLRKAFGKTEVLKGVDLKVEAGTVFALLGPNGAGKTTLVNILTTLMRPDEGTALVFGCNSVSEADLVRSRISLTGQFAALDEDLTGRESLTLVARLTGWSAREAARRADELLEAFGLSEAAGRPAVSYSGGMRRRLDIAAGLVVMPDLLVLDEPTTGLDPRSRSEVWDIVRTLASHGTTILLTTQYLEEADRLADRIAVLDHGRVIAEGKPSELKASVGSGTVRLTLADPGHRPQAERIISRLIGADVRAGAADPAELSVPASDPELAGMVLVELSRAGIAPVQFSIGQPSLDEVFLALTGKPADGAADGMETFGAKGADRR